MGEQGEREVDDQRSAAPMAHSAPFLPFFFFSFCLCSFAVAFAARRIAVEVKRPPFHFSFLSLRGNTGECS